MSKPVPETLLKQKRAGAKALAEARRKAGSRKAKVAVKKAEIFKRAEKYVKEYKAKERSLINLRRAARSAGNFFVEPEAKVAFVVRVRGSTSMDPRSKKILELLRLQQIYNGVFVKLNGATKNMLRLVTPYITWGSPSLKSVRDLLYKRGHGKHYRQRIPFTDNSIIERTLGRYNIICIEDLVHEIFTVGPNFRAANAFIWPFQLNPPRGGLSKKRNHFIVGGNHGERAEYINQLIAAML